MACEAAREADRATIAEQAKRIRVLEAQNLTYRLADNPATVEAFQSEMEEAEATIAELRAKLSAAVEAAAVGEAVIAAIRGEEVSEFAASFGPVREAMMIRELWKPTEAELREEYRIREDNKGFRAEVRRLEDRIRALEDMFVEAAGWRSADNPTGPEERIRHEGRAILARREGRR